MFGKALLDLPGDPQRAAAEAPARTKGGFASARVVAQFQLKRKSRSGGRQIERDTVGEGTGVEGRTFQGPRSSRGL